jgi:DHA1 family bicyclomycin/chloramphenicol resistance-like MFS transporter
LPGPEAAHRIEDVPVRAATAPPPRGLVPIIAMMSMIGPFTIDTYLPSFPDIAAEFGIGLPAMAQTLSVYLIAFAVSTLAWGPLADTFGRRRVSLAAMGLYIATSAGCALVDNLGHMLVLRFMQGIAASGGIVIARAVVRDVYQGVRARKAMSQVMMVFALAPAAAPIIGGWLHDSFGWRSVFHFLALYGLATTALMFWHLPETHPPELRQSIHPRAVLRNYFTALQNGRFIALVLTFCFFFGGMFLYILGSPAIIYDHLGLGANSFAVQFVPMVSGVVCGAWAAGRLAAHVEPARLINASLVFAALVAGLNLALARWAAPTPVTVVGPIVLYAFTMSLAMPTLTVMALDCLPRNRGVASAVQAFIQMNLNGLIAALAVPLVAPSLVAFALVQALLLLLAAFVWLLR